MLFHLRGFHLRGENCISKYLDCTRKAEKCLILCFVVSKMARPFNRSFATTDQATYSLRENTIRSRNVAISSFERYLGDLPSIVGDQPDSWKYLKPGNKKDGWTLSLGDSYCILFEDQKVFNHTFAKLCLNLYTNCVQF